MQLTVKRGSAKEYTDQETGKGYYSVSQCLAVLDPDAFAGVDPFVLAAAQQRGTDLHILLALTVLAIAGTCDFPERPTGLIGKYYEGIERFVKECKPEPIKVEESSINDAMGYAGTPDLYCGMAYKGPRAIWLLDLKTGPARPVHSVQLHAYKKLDGYEKAKRLGSLYITKQGTYKIIEHTHDHVDAGGFQAALSILNWRQLRG